MADKINGYGKAGVEMATARAQAAKRAATGTQSGAATQRPAAGDALQLTGTAARLKAIEARLATLPEVDQARVQALREQLASGQYQPDPARIAAKLIRLDGALG